MDDGSAWQEAEVGSGTRSSRTLWWAKNCRAWNRHQWTYRIHPLGDENIDSCITFNNKYSQRQNKLDKIMLSIIAKWIQQNNLICYKNNYLIRISYQMYNII